jgi:prophage antirepressor-like protein
VCEALDLTSPHKVAERLDDDEKGRSLIPTLGGKQKFTIINESGLYNVILRSDKQQAEKFKRLAMSKGIERINHNVEKFEMGVLKV